MLADISGFWTGTYWYDEPGEPTVPFLALMREANGALSGEISEPNSVGHSSEELKAFIVGTREGNAVGFAKVYDGASDLAHRVDYIGTLSGDTARLTGYWMLDDYSGGFEMSRTILPADELAITEVEVAGPVGATAPIKGE